MAYEELKRWCFEQKRKTIEASGNTYGQANDKLVGVNDSCITYRLS